MTTTQPLLEALNIETGYGDTTIVFDATVKVHPGEIVTIIGPNGAGKSTLLKAIFGTLPIRKSGGGSLSFDGRDVSDWSAPQMVKGGAVFVPQTANVFAALTIRENLNTGGYILRRGLKQRVEEVLEIFPELKTRQSEHARNLSGGQRQSLAIARALITAPRLMLLDEPTAALSPKATRRLFDLIKEIAKTGVAVLLVEQNATEALAISDRGYVMVDGKTVMEDEARAILNNPRIGAMFLGQEV